MATKFSPSPSMVRLRLEKVVRLERQEKGQTLGHTAGVEVLRRLNAMDASELSEQRPIAIGCALTGAVSAQKAIPTSVISKIHYVGGRPLIWIGV